MNKHTTFKLMKRVRVVLYDGRVVVDKLTDQRSRFYVFQTIGKVQTEDIKSISYYKKGEG